MVREVSRDRGGEQGTVCCHVHIDPCLRDSILPTLHIYLYLRVSITYLSTCITSCSALPRSLFMHSFFLFSIFFSFFLPPYLSWRHGCQEALNYFNSLCALQFRYLPFPVLFRDIHVVYIHATDNLRDKNVRNIRVACYTK